MKKIDKIHNISWDGKHTFKITSICGEINAEVIFYNPVDDRNKATGKGSRKYNYGLMLSCYEYKNAKIETEFGLPYGTLGSVEKVTEIFNKYSEMEVNRITSWHGAQLLQSEFEKYTFGQKESISKNVTEICCKKNFYLREGDTLDIFEKYKILKSDFDFISKENLKLHNKVVNQARQINNLKKRLEGSELKR